MAVRRRVVVVGAGVGGLATSIVLGAAGAEVLLVERAATPGGKMREIEVAGRAVDAGPTVLTMRWVFDELARLVGSSLEQHVELSPVSVLARHVWPGGEALDLHADVERTADAVGALAGAAASRGYAAFVTYARQIYETVEGPFLRQQRPTFGSMLRDASTIGLTALARIDAHRTMWRALGDFFPDPRLRQLFGRYATYVGSSPFAAPATLNLISHVERAGVWRVRGGMYRLVEALAAMARAQGVAIRYGARVDELLARGGRVSGVRLASGEVLEASAVVVNADASAVGAGLFGRAAAGAVPALPREDRSFSARTLALVARAGGAELVHHNVFFSADYRREMADLGRGIVPDDPTIYLCAQDRSDDGQAKGEERMLIVINAPADGDRAAPGRREIEPWTMTVLERLRRSGLSLQTSALSASTPADFESLSPGTGGALYGRAARGAFSSLTRPAARTKIPGLYLAGGSAHPGAGVPMAALSGRLAANALLEDWASSARSSTVAMPGSISMP